MNSKAGRTLILLSARELGVQKCLVRTQLGGGGGVAAVQSWEDSKERKAAVGGKIEMIPPGKKHLQLTYM